MKLTIAAGTALLLLLPVEWPSAERSRPLPSLALIHELEAQGLSDGQARCLVHAFEQADVSEETVVRLVHTRETSIESYRTFSELLLAC